MTGRNFSWMPNIATNYGMDVAKGLIKKHETGTIFGRNRDVDPAAPELIWDFGGIETYLTADTEIFLSSTSASDTNVGVFVWGMTDDYNFKIETHIFTSGQSQQSIGNFFRIFRLVIVSNDAPLGDIYAAEADTLTLGVPDTDSKVHALMDQGSNITHKAGGTVPVGHTLYVHRAFMGVRRGEDAVIALRSRADTSPAFVESTSFPIYQQALFLHLDPPFIITEKTDFDFLASTVTNNTEVVLNLGFTLVDNRA